MVYQASIGEKAREIYYTFVFENEEDKMKLEPVMAKFEEYFRPKNNITLDSSVMIKLKNKPSMAIESQISALCVQRSEKKNLIRDKMVLGVHTKKVQEILLRESDLTLDKSATICRAAEEIKLQTKEMQSQNKQERASKVDYLKRKKKVNSTKSKSEPTLTKQCSYCG